MQDLMENKLVELLIERKLTITTAESCTGGMVSSTIVNVPGASHVLNEAYVTYSNEAKHRLLGVSVETLEKHDAVSVNTAREMAIGAAMSASVDCAISVTGLAGPEGGTSEIPVGTVYAGFFILGEVKVIKYKFDGDRFSVRRQAADAVITEMYKLLIS